MKPLKNHNSPITSKMTIKDIDLLEWVLLPEEIEYIRDCARGEENIIRYAIQTCCLRLTGRFITVYNQVSLKICNHLAKQFNLDLLHKTFTEPHPNTEVRIRKQISKFLALSK